MAQRFLLSIDGGGIRGIIPAVALARLEQITRRPVRELFSFVAGTSTGGVIAAAAAAGIPMEQVVTLYRERARDVFVQSPFNLFKRIVAGWMYPSQSLYDVIRQELGPQRDWRLNDSPIDLLLTAKSVSDGKPWYFVRDSPRNSGRTGQLSLADCVTASAAAPTYFSPWMIRCGREGALGPMIDGGVGVAGNPVYQACVEALEYAEGYTASKLTVISFGTGRFLREARPGWIGGWLSWILDELLESPGEQQTELVHRHYPQARFYRLDPDIHKLAPSLRGEIRLDAIDRIDELWEIGQRFADQIDWPAIIAGTDQQYRVHAGKTSWYQYCRS